MGRLRHGARANRPISCKPSNRWPSITNSTRTPWKDLPAHVKQVFLHGSNDEELPFRYDEGGRVYNVTRAFEGVIPNMERRYRETDSAWIREEFRALSEPARLRHMRRPPAETRSAGGQDWWVACRAGDRDVDPRGLAWVDGVPASLSKQKNEIARAILKEIRERIGFLVNVGLDYLTLGRHAGTLSGGESQRIRLASQIGSGLTGVLYVLDEPSIGLHQRDNDRLLITLRNLRDQGNTVIVVEHDEEAIRTADYVLDIGPGAGVHGGRDCGAGHPGRDHGGPASLTGQYLSGAREIAVPKSGARAMARN
jgi:excinuclease ABC subunit A